ncbi:MAG TPA: hypothetical protein PKY77_24925 [Phycisphaerae bacterium]|nr:hypothetical protein [Phycisphaerae bacterium]
MYPALQLKNYSTRRRGWTAAQCPLCGTVEAFLAEEHVEKALYCGVAVSERKTAETITCEFCGLSQTPAISPVVTNHLWMPGLHIQKLVDATAPHLGTVGRQVKHREAIAAMLKVMLRTAERRHGLLNAGLMIGLGAGGVIGLGILGLFSLVSDGLGYHSSEWGSMAFFVLVLVGMTGSIVGGALWQVHGIREFCADHLAYRARSHNLDAGELRAAMIQDKTFPEWLVALTGPPRESATP